MTADEYLTSTGKKPFSSDGFWWNWGREMEDEDPASEDYDMVVPPDVFDAMDGKVAYPTCHVYRTESEAVEAFRKAWDKARGETR